MTDAHGATVDAQPSDADGTVQVQKDEVRSVYEEIADEYDERMAGFGPADAAFATAELDFLMRKVQGSDHVLDLGCGTGRFTVPMAKVAAQVTGLDLSPAMLGVLKNKAREEGVDILLKEGDMAELPFADESFDVVTCMLAMMHVPLTDRRRAFAEVARVLRPAGRALLGVKNSKFEQFFSGDRFAAIDTTDVASHLLRFTRTRSGQDLKAAWYSFSPEDIAALFAVSGMTLTHLRGNSPLSAWLADEILQDQGISAFVRSIESLLADVPPFNHLGYHLLVEGTKVGRWERSVGP